MKKIITTILLLLSFYAPKAQTTWTEYNYLKKGVVDYLDRGIDLKSGYKLTKAGNYTLNFRDGARTTTLFNFIKIGNKIPSALLIIYSKANSNKKVYIVLPTANAPEDMWADYTKTLNTINNTGAALETVSYSLGHYISTKFQNQEL
jgi:hypothetical protein